MDLWTAATEGGSSCGKSEGAPAVRRALYQDHTQQLGEVVGVLTPPTDEDTETRKAEVTCLRSHSWQGTELPVSGALDVLHPTFGKAGLSWADASSAVG